MKSSFETKKIKWFSSDNVKIIKTLHFDLTKKISLEALLETFDFNKMAFLDEKMFGQKFFNQLYFSCR